MTPAITTPIILFQFMLAPTLFTFVHNPEYKKPPEPTSIQALEPRIEIDESKLHDNAISPLMYDEELNLYVPH